MESNAMVESDARAGEASGSAFAETVGTEEQTLRRAARGLVSAVAREPRLWWNIIRYDVSASIIPATIFTLAAWRAAGGHAEELLPAFLQGSLYFFLYILSFAFSAQISSIDEDLINKPDRPLPRGDVSLLGAQIRTVLAMGMYLLVGYQMGVFGWTLLWVVTSLLHNQLKGSTHWFIKDLCMGVGTVAMLGAAWELACAPTEAAVLWLIVLPLAVFTLVPLQDLRDVEGDKAVNRRTMPMVLGDKGMRWYSAIGFVLLAVVSPWLLISTRLLSGNASAPIPMALALAFSAVLVGICLRIAYRVMRLRTVEHDHQTYLLFTYWYCVILTSAIFVM